MNEQSKPVNRSLKVLIIGGPDVDRRIDLMRSLASKYQVSAVGSSRDLLAYFQEAGFRYQYYPLARKINPLTDMISLFILITILLREKPVIVHCFDTKPLVIARLAAKICQVPVIVGTVTGLGTLYQHEKLIFRIVRSVYETFQKLACHISDLTIFYNRDDLQQFVRRGIVPESKTTIVNGSGVHTARFNAATIPQDQRHGLRAEFGISSETILVTMISRIVRSKGVLEFSRVAEIIKSMSPETDFLLIGPHDKESIDVLSEKEISQLKQTVIWPGPREDIPRILAASDIFLFLSHHEGLPRVLLEASAMGLPLIATYLPGCKEVIVEGTNGFLVPVGDTESIIKATLNLIRNRELRSKFGQASCHIARTRFDTSSVSKQIIHIYLHLLREKKGYITNG